MTSMRFSFLAVLATVVAAARNRIPAQIMDPATGLFVPNPAYNGPAKTAPQGSLPIMSTVEEVQEYQLQPTASAHKAAELIELHADNLKSNLNEIQHGLAALFAKHEVPIGLLQKLFVMDSFDSICFLVDDSGSMRSDVTDEDNNLYDVMCELQRRGYSGGKTRWVEACYQILTMLEILQYIPKGPIEMRFLNNANRITLVQGDASPQQFYHQSKEKVLFHFAQHAPEFGTTPLLRCLQTLFTETQGLNVAYYLFLDGKPDNPKTSIPAIESLITFRPNPSQNPVTFISCSDQRGDFEWMKQLDESAPSCAELDDFEHEQNEVIGDQGTVFPYSRGVYLICMLVGAMNPNDLDALDEFIPLTKYALYNLLGADYKDTPYDKYFDEVIAVQRTKTFEKADDFAFHMANLDEIVSHKGEFATIEAGAHTMRFIEAMKDRILKRQGLQPIRGSYQGGAPGYQTQPQQPNFSQYATSGYPGASYGHTTTASSYGHTTASSYGKPTAPSYDQATAPSYGYAVPSYGPGYGSQHTPSPQTAYGYGGGAYGSGQAGAAYGQARPMTSPQGPNPQAGQRHGSFYAQYQGQTGSGHAQARPPTSATASAPPLPPNSSHYSQPGQGGGYNQPGQAGGYSHYQSQYPQSGQGGGYNQWH